MNPLIHTIRRERPLVHCISNLVTANDCANLLLAIGASPTMAQAPEEMAEITAQADALVLNTGTPSGAKYEACRLAGQTANRLGIPVVLDPVGVGASTWRLENVRRLLEEVHPAVIRANFGEAEALLGRSSRERGVDSLPAQEDGAAELAEALARKYGCTVLLTGRVDVVTHGEQKATLSGGSERMKCVTGAGCMLSALCGAFASVTDPFRAAAEASRLWKDAARIAEQAAGEKGLGSFHAALFDVISNT